MITFTCDSCRKKFTVKDELAGKKAKCPGCGNPLIVPRAAASVAAQARDKAAGLEDSKTISSGAAAAAPDRTLPPKSAGQASQDSVSEEGGQTALGIGGKG